MSTVQETLRLLMDYHYKRLKSYDKRFVKNCLDGLSGLGEVDDVIAAEYLTEDQVAYARRIGERFLIKKSTNIRR